MSLVSVDRWKNLLRAEVAENVANALKEFVSPGDLTATFGPLMDTASILNLLSEPPKFELGQCALPCFPFSKSLKLAPQIIAAKLCEILRARLHSYYDKIEVAGGYLNFHCNFDVTGEKLIASILSLKTPSSVRAESRPKNSGQIVVEYSQPNTHKALHVGHLRCLVFGDVICNLLQATGHQVTRATYPGDMGTHVAKVLWYLQHHKDLKLPETDRFNWLARTYVAADLEYKSATGIKESDLEAEISDKAESKNSEKKSLKEKPVPEKETSLRAKAELREIFVKLKLKQGEIYETWVTTREWSLDQMREVYTWLETPFDLWFFESECDEPSRTLAKELLSEGSFIVSDGAVGVDLSESNLGFAMYLKSDGNGLYLTKDLELARRKFSAENVERSIYVVDSRQKLHFKQLFKTIEILENSQSKTWKKDVHSENVAQKLFHLPYETVNTPDGKPFSSREGRGLGIFALKEVMEAKVTNDYLERYRGNWPDSEIEATARVVTIGALKYGMLKVDNNTQVNFVLEDWLKLDGDTGPYLQYVHARCLNILEKQGSGQLAPVEYKEISEKELLFALSQFGDTVAQASAQLKPSSLTTYLFALGKSFNRFYEECPIKGSEGVTRNSRLLIVEACAETVKAGLSLLGIPAPARM